MKRLLVLLITGFMLLAVGCSGKKANQAVNNVLPYETIDFLWDDTKASTKAPESNVVKPTENNKDEESTNSSDVALGETAGQGSQKETASASKEDIKTQEQWEAYLESISGNVYFTDLKGKSVKYVEDKGFTGYATSVLSSDSSPDEYTIHMIYRKSTSEVEKIRKELETMTVQQLKDKYFGISIDVEGKSGNYKYSCDIGTIKFEFDLDNGEKAMKGHEDDFFFDLEDATEVQNDKLKNVKFVEMVVYGVLDEDSAKKVAQYGDSYADEIEKNAGSMIFEKVYYCTK